jgi:hypothetical protein
VVLLAELLLDSARRPYTEDWCIDAGRAFLVAYRLRDSTPLAALLGDYVLSLMATFANPASPSPSAASRPSSSCGSTRSTE